MIGVEGQYLLKFSIGKVEDFVDEEDLKDFTLIEEAGNVLPQFELVFTTRTIELLSELTEGNVLQISLGRDALELTPAPFIIFSKRVAKSGQDKYSVRLTGLYAAPKYIAEDRTGWYEGSSVQVIEEVAGRYFRVQNEASSSSDVQVWLQTSIPDKAFVTKVWMHSYLEGSVLLLAITSVGDFLIKDVKRLAGQEPRWRFVPRRASGAREVDYTGDYEVISETGFLNQYAGYRRTVNKLEVESSTLSTIEVNASPILGLSPVLDRSAEISKRVVKQMPYCDNVHSHYWDAYFHNLALLSALSSTRIRLSTGNYFFPIRPLDLVYFSEFETAQRQVVSPYSGLYIVSKVSRVIRDKRFFTNVEITREVINFAKGALA